MRNQRGLARDAPRPRRIERGEELLDRQGTPNASGFRGIQGLGPVGPTRFGGGTSPTRTRHTIQERDRGRVAMWEGDGYLALSHLTDSPNDGQIYGRRGRDWVVLGELPPPTTAIRWDQPDQKWDQPGLRWDQRTGRSAAAAGERAGLPYILPDSPLDGQGYVRVGLNQTWKPAFTQAQADARYAPIDTVSFPEPPADGQAYARRAWDRSWVAVATGTGVPEAPPDGGNYLRNGATETWQRAWGEAQADQRYALLIQVVELTARVSQLEAQLAALGERMTEWLRR